MMKYHTDRCKFGDLTAQRAVSRCNSLQDCNYSQLMFCWVFNLGVVSEVPYSDVSFINAPARWLPDVCGRAELFPGMNVQRRMEMRPKNKRVFSDVSLHKN